MSEVNQEKRSGGETTRLCIDDHFYAETTTIDGEEEIKKWG